MAMTTLKARLLQNDLLFSFNLNYPKDFAEILVQTENYAQAEEVWNRQGENFDSRSQPNVRLEKKKDYR